VFVAAGRARQALGLCGFELQARRNMNTKPIAKASGFTLLELMVTLSVAAILTAIAVPSMRTFAEDNALAAIDNTLVASLNYARSEAVKRGGGTTICVSPASSASVVDWNQGWGVDTACASSGLQKVAALAQSSITIRSDASSNQVIFLPDGSLQSGMSATFTVCDSRGAAYARQVEVTAGGRALMSASAGQPVDTTSTTSLTCP
jgi:type IV fimbrial biogenesis protein FimT